MIGLDVCSWHSDPEGLCAVYSTELTLAAASFVLNVAVMCFAFTGDRFNPHTSMMRTLLFIDVMGSLGQAFEAMSALLRDDADLPADLLPPYVTFTTVGTCVSYRSYLFLILVGRQWAAVLVLIMGLERFLFICYPLWFKVVRVRRFPIIMFTTCFVGLSASIGYTNALVVAPDENIHFVCDATWAFGDNYGWCQSGIIILCLLTGWSLNFYSYCVAKKESALLHFGNNRQRMNSERRKIRKAMWILSVCLLFGALPQMAIVVLRLISRWQFQSWKLVISQLFLTKAFANLYLVTKLGRGGKGLFGMTVKCLCSSAPITKNRIDVGDSIVTISQNIQ